jgi:short-subunit dehydrogenase
MQKNFNILITGASSGIGRSLAINSIKNYAKNNLQINLFLIARNPERLELTKNLCFENFHLIKEKFTNFNLQIFCKIISVENEKEMQNYLAEITQDFFIDLAIANAGISAGTSGLMESNNQIRKIFNTNINGVLNTINPLINSMIANKKGQIAIISSLAGFRGLPSSPAYSASKAAVRVYGEGLRGNLAKFGIKVNVICPGYIKTPMTANNNFFMPFLIDDQKCAKIIFSGLNKNASRIAFPFGLYFIIWLLTLISPKITDYLFAKLPAKKSLD